MKRHLLVLTAALLGGAALSGADIQRSATPDAAAAFARLKGLVGEWHADTPQGKAKLRYELIAAGNTLIEHEIMDGMGEMLTAYHLDGKRLLLTHYCMAGNQPRMEAQAYDPSTGDLKFRFLDATNLANPAAGHMHDVAMRFVDADHFSSQWQFYEDNKPKMTEKFDYVRVK